MPIFEHNQKNMHMQEEDIHSTTGLEYNTQRPDLRIPSYGRNIQKMIKYALAINDKKERNKIAEAIVSVMGQVNPELKEIEDLNHKLWTHLFVISDFELEVDSPYPMPEKEKLMGKPDSLDYPHNNIRYGHYGICIQNMLKVIGEFDEGAEKRHLTELMANLMKRTYLTWNRPSVDDDLIIKQMKELSNGKVNVSEDTDIDGTSEILKELGFVNKQKKKKSNKKKK